MRIVCCTGILLLCTNLHAQFLNLNAGMYLPVRADSLAGQHIRLIVIDHYQEEAIRKVPKNKVETDSIFFDSTGHVRLHYFINEMGSENITPNCDSISDLEYCRCDSLGRVVEFVKRNVHGYKTYDANSNLIAARRIVFGFDSATAVEYTWMKYDSLGRLRYVYNKYGIILNPAVRDTTWDLEGRDTVFYSGETIREIRATVIEKEGTATLVTFKHFYESGKLVRTERWWKTSRKRSKPSLSDVWLIHYISG